jgi:hypothetical protein
MLARVLKVLIAHCRIFFASAYITCPDASVAVCLLLLFAGSPGHPVDEGHARGGFLAEEGRLVVDIRCGRSTCRS